MNPWPFLLRSTHTRMLAENARLTETANRLIASHADKSGECDRLREQNMTLNARCLAVEGALERQNARYESLSDRFLQLRLAGGQDTPVHVAAKPKERDVLEQAVLSHPAARNPEMRSRMLHQLRLDRQAIATGFVSENAVLERIMMGDPAEGSPQ